jgi:hypothetical protein
LMQTRYFMHYSILPEGRLSLADFIKHSVLIQCVSSRLPMNQSLGCGVFTWQPFVHEIFWSNISSTGWEKDVQISHEPHLSLLITRFNRLSSGPPSTFLDYPVVNKSLLRAHSNWPITWQLDISVSQMLWRRKKLSDFVRLQWSFETVQKGVKVKKLYTQLNGVA